MEEWKELVEFKPSRETKKMLISNFGNIKRITNYGEKLSKRNGCKMYYKIGINDKTYRIHCLVAKYFIPNPNPNEYKMIDHIDRNKHNNHYKNLRWCNHSINNVNRNNKGSCSIVKDGRKKKFYFGYTINKTRYTQSFYTEEEQLEFQKLYNELIQDGFIH